MLERKMERRERESAGGKMSEGLIKNSFCQAVSLNKGRTTPISKEEERKNHSLF